MANFLSKALPWEPGCPWHWIYWRVGPQGDPQKAPPANLLEKTHHVLSSPFITSEISICLSHNHTSYHISYHISFHMSYHISFHVSHHISYHIFFHTSYQIFYHTSYHISFHISYHIFFHTSFEIYHHISIRISIPTMCLPHIFLLCGLTPIGGNKNNLHLLSFTHSWLAVGPSYGNLADEWDECKDLRSRQALRLRTKIMVRPGEDRGELTTGGAPVCREIEGYHRFTLINKISIWNAQRDMTWRYQRNILSYDSSWSTP